MISSVSSRAGTPCRRRASLDGVEQPQVADVLGRQVDGDADVVGTADSRRQIAASAQAFSMTQLPISTMRPERSATGRNSRGASRPRVGVVPADEGLHRVQPAGLGGHLGQVVQHQLVAGDGAAEAGLDVEAGRGGLATLGAEDARAGRSRVTGLEQGRARVAYQLGHGAVGVGADGDADARDDADLGVRVADRRGDGLAQLEREQLGRDLGRRLLAHHDELVAAEPGDGVGDPAASRMRAGERSQDDVTGSVAVGVVDDREAVDVDDQDREPGGLAGGEPGQRALDPVVEERAVGQAGQRVVHGRVVEGLVGADEGGDVVVDDEGAAGGQPAQPHRVGGAFALDGAGHVVRGDLAVEDAAQAGQRLAGPALVAPRGQDRGIAGADACSDRTGCGTGEVAGDRVGPAPVGGDHGPGPVEHGDRLAQRVEHPTLGRVADGEGVDGPLALDRVADRAAQQLAVELAEQDVVLGALVHREDAEALVVVVVDDDDDGDRGDEVRRARTCSRAPESPADERDERAHGQLAGERRIGAVSDLQHAKAFRRPASAARTRSAETPPSTSSSMGAANVDGTA